MNYLTSTQKVPVVESIKRRRSIGQMTSEQPSREQIESLLEAATYAPNHHVTEP
ncbi:MAG TPA: nitroreductase family protein, partial [Ktedonobacteraceae bacterium]|nr:nitroreductase family protein [Ktedonobacteraceae bacterium]